MIQPVNQSVGVKVFDGERMKANQPCADEPIPHPRSKWNRYLESHVEPEANEVGRENLQEHQVVLDEKAHYSRSNVVSWATETFLTEVNRSDSVDFLKNAFQPRRASRQKDSLQSRQHPLAPSRRR
jgi:hypothetical protein